MLHSQVILHTATNIYADPVPYFFSDAALNKHAKSLQRSAENPRHEKRLLCLLLVCMRSTCFWAAAWLRVTICEAAGAADAVRLLLPLGCVCLAAPAVMLAARLSVDCLPVVIC